MFKSQQFYREKEREGSNFAKYFHALCALIYLIIIYTAIHDIKNSILGEYVSYEKHFKVTTLINFCLLIGSVIFIRYYFEEFAFTLVELAIVLIIIGFIIAGIAAGTSLVESSRLNGFIAEMRNYQTAALTFRERYNAVPGDFARAHQTFGSIGGCINDDVNNNSSGCNGNGNGILGHNPNWREGPRAWQHLAAAGMIGGTYNGTSDSPKIQSLGTRNSDWIFFSDGSTVYNVPPQTFNIINAQGRNGNTPFISSSNAYAIDNKIDDGKPAKGFMRAFDINNSFSCAVLADGVTNVTFSYGGDPNGVFYRLTNNALACTSVYFYIYDIPQ